LLGFKKIIFVGLDLAFTGGAGHTKGFAIVEDDEEIKEKAAYQVEGWDGELINTDGPMKQYLEWFNNTIKSNMSDIEFIDATEGGARKDGARRMTLKDAVDTYCISSVDFDTYIREASPALSEREREMFLKRLNNISRELTEYKDRLKEYESSYRHLAEKLIEGKAQKAEIDSIYRKVSEAGRIDETEKYYHMVSLFNTSKSYEFKDIVMDMDKPVTDILYAGAELMKCYQDNIDGIKKLIIKFWGSSNVFENDADKYNR
jgi:hypothetical protein